MDWVVSKHGVPIRLTDERWQHIIDQHPDMDEYRDEVLGTVEDPEWILRSYGGALIAMRSMGRRGYLSVIYRELGPHNGFVITAFFASRIDRSKVIWPRRR